MKIIVNTTSLIPPLSGIGHYTQQLLKCLLDSKHYDKNLIDEISGFNPLKLYTQEELRQLVFALDNEDTDKKTGSSLNQLKKIRSIAKHIPGARPLKKRLQQRILKKYTSNNQDTIYWEPNTILEDFDGISIPVIYDLSHIHYPQFHPQERINWLNDNLEDTLERAAQIITISAFSQQEIIDNFAIAKEKITIIPPAVSDKFRQTFERREIQQIQKIYQLPEQFILSVGTIEPRKNIKGLLAAYNKLPESLKNTCPLVIVGCNGWLSKEVEQLMKPLSAKGQVLRLGYVQQDDLPKLYAAAILFIYISYYEGYGMPIAEAMCSGVPVITSSVSSMPEVAAGCAQLVHPENIEEISLAIQELLENTPKRTELINKAKLKSGRYTWEQSAQSLLKLFSRFQVQ